MATQLQLARAGCLRQALQLRLRGLAAQEGLEEPVTMHCLPPALLQIWRPLPGALLKVAGTGRLGAHSACLSAQLLLLVCAEAGLAI